MAAGGSGDQETIETSGQMRVALKVVHLHRGFIARYIGNLLCFLLTKRQVN